MTASDIYVMLREVKDVAPGRWILNIYQLNGTLLFKLSHESPNKIWLLIEPGRRMHLTSHTYEREAKLRAFCKTLRKHLRNHKIAEIEQHDFDRVVYFRVGPPEKQFTLVVELFGGGNAVLLDPLNRIISAMTYRRMRDRDIVRGAPFEFPPLRATDPRTVSLEELSEIISSSDRNLVPTLVRGLNMSGDTAEEILSKTQIKPNLQASKLNDEQKQKLHQTLKSHFKTLFTGELNPHVLLNDSQEPVQVLPIDSSRFSYSKRLAFSSFNEALDHFYSTFHEEQVVEEIDETYQKKLAKLQRLLEQQQDHLETMQNRAEKSRSAANSIHQNLPLLEELVTTIKNARQRGMSWNEITDRLEEGKSKELPSAMLLETIHPKTGQVQVSLDNQLISLDIRLSAAENANRMFQRGKQLEKKVSGAKIAIEDTKKKISQHEEKHEDALVQADTVRLDRRRKKEWYEKFRWFQTSQESLVLGGRDAASNQQLIRKYLEDQDLFFHADFSGAPVVIAKTESRTLSAEELQEIAIFAVCNSRAWKSGWSRADAYWVRSDQVSLSAPSGEFLAKGAVMVRGERNYIRGLPLRIAVGILSKDESYIVISGPESAIQQKTEKWVTLIPGKMKVSDAAKKIRVIFSDQVPSEFQKQVQGISIDEIIAILPPGPVDFVKK
jgi:predicted ribosome quality control (RQC) complex YloA/Tae2 family protein